MNLYFHGPYYTPTFIILGWLKKIESLNFMLQVGMYIKGNNDTNQEL